MAGGSNSITSETYMGLSTSPATSKMVEILVGWVADDGTGVVPALSNTSYAGWKIAELVINPGDPAPSEDHDITITDTANVDMIDGQGADLSATASKRIKIGFPPIIGSDGFIVNVSGNSVNSADGTIRIFLVRD